MVTRFISVVMPLTMVAVAATSCGDVVRSSRSPVMLTVNSLGVSGSSNATPINSDVVNTTTPPCSPQSPCLGAADDAQVVLGVVMKDVTVAPTTNNQVTVTHYHVAYRRTDGRNTQGVDVPYAFDGGMTMTIPANATGAGIFQIVRKVAKEDPPLINLMFDPRVISTIADVTFYGADQVGNEVTVTGSVLVNFGNFTD